MAKSLYFIYDGQRHKIALDHDVAPRTLAILLQHVPARIDLHCAKIAGRHIFWHAPFLTPLEQGQDVLSAAPGTFLYWPERQFLELTYGELQAESAQVTVLGHLTGKLDWLIALGERLRREQGHRIIWARLEADAPANDSDAKLSAALPAQSANGLGDESLSCALRAELAKDVRFTGLQAARQQAWTEQPESITELTARRGILLPYGPLAMAEGEFRKLQELLWRYCSPHADSLCVESKAQHAAFLIEAFVTRIVDLCGMEACRDTLLGASQLLRERPDAFTPIMHELILYCGRFAAWLDLYIPWNDLNEVVINAQSQG